MRITAKDLRMVEEVVGHGCVASVEWERRGLLLIASVGTGVREARYQELLDAIEMASLVVGADVVLRTFAEKAKRVIDQCVEVENAA